MRQETITRVALVRRPDRQGGGTVPGEEGHPGRRTDRRVHPVAGARQAVQEAMGIQHGITQAAGQQLLVEALVIGTLRQPDAEGPLAEQSLMLPNGGQELGLNRFGRLAQQRQIPVGGGAGEQVEHAGLLEQAEAKQQVSGPGGPTSARVFQLFGQGLRSRRMLRLLLGRRNPGQQGEPLLQPGRKLMVQINVAQQRQQGGGEAEAEPWPLVWIDLAALQQAQQGQIALQQGLKVPVLLQGPWLAAADVGEMGMEDEGQGTSDHPGTINPEILRARKGPILIDQSHSFETSEDRAIPEIQASFSALHHGNWNNSSPPGCRWPGAVSCQAKARSPA